MSKSCVDCQHRLGLGPADDRHWFCRWLDSVLPPPLVEALEYAVPALQHEILEEDLETTAEVCSCYAPAEPERSNDEKES